MATSEDAAAESVVLETLQHPQQARMDAEVRRPFRCLKTAKIISQSVTSSDGQFARKENSKGLIQFDAANDSIQYNQETTRTGKPELKSRLTTGLYWNQYATVQTTAGKLRQICIRSAVREGCIISAVLLTSTITLHPFNSLFPGQPGRAGSGKVNRAMASAGPYANYLHLAAER